MRRFAQLYNELDTTTSTTGKLAALARYFAEAPVTDAAWATYFLAGGKPRRVVPTRLLRDAAGRVSGLEEWLFQECYDAVGDLAETIALVLPPPEKNKQNLSLTHWIEQGVAGMRGLDPELMQNALIKCWSMLDRDERFLFCKLISGAFRVGVSKLLVQRALAKQAGINVHVLAQRMMGYLDASLPPTPLRYSELLAPEDDNRAQHGKPYPFFLAHQLNDSPASVLGNPADWQVEWKYDGIRAQLVHHDGIVAVWSRGEELMTDRFPEIVAVGKVLPVGTVLDGEILVWRDGCPLPFAILQRRIGRKTVSHKVLRDAPVHFIAYDLLEESGIDLRVLPQAERRARLESCVGQVKVAHAELPLNLSPLIGGHSWEALTELREQSRSLGVEGVMLKHRRAQYGVGRSKSSGIWWKWKVDPLSIDAVLIYAQRGHGRRASLYTDFTFALWEDTGGERRLVPFAKAYSGLTDDEFKRIDAIVRKTTQEKFGPVRSVEPTQVFELGFEGIQHSARHKSGVAVRFPRMLRWRTDKRIEDAGTVDELKALLGS